ncbi:MAG: alpha/beta hydrolase [Anaerolineae bacterium]|nr:alpha/beta hydrolase [Anaerolineae bacterium]RIK22237.1 MAG: 2-hydroxy-6-oxo-6-phenylhexa-2,4-dienoate hydrolase [Chloroflexota bacterium]
MDECSVNGVTVKYTSAGSGLPLVMLHGWGADHRLAERMIEPAFAHRSGWRRIYPDLPGMGCSAPAQSIRSHDDMLAVVEGFIDSLAGSERFVVGGVSYGGYLAQGLVQHMGDRIDGLLLVVPSVERDRARQHFPPHEVRIVEPAFAENLMHDEKWLTDTIVVQTMSVLDQVREELLPALGIANPEFLQRLGRENSLSFDVRSPARPFTAPTLVLAGRQDSVTGYREALTLIEHYPHGTFAVLDSAGHMLHREQQAVFRSLVSEWVDRVEIGRNGGRVPDRHGKTR